MKSLRAGIIKAGFLFILIFGGLFTVKAQYKVSGEIIDVGSAFHDVYVALESDGINNEITITTDGKFDTYLDWNKVHQFSFRKPGYVTKVIEFSTYLPDNIHPETIQPYYLPVRLFKMFEGVDTVFFNQPVAKIHYDDQLADFADDRDYSLKVKYKIDGMRKKGIEKQKKNRQRETFARNNENQRFRKDNTLDSASETDKKEYKNELINGLPPLKMDYPQGRTDERFELEGRIIERTVFVDGIIRKVYYVVKHDWGGVFYFIDQADLGYRCISKDAYLNLLTTCEISNKKYK